ncbi:glycosyltransferase family 39 protein [Haloterrigena sp. SYSU A121-1]|uniref:Glycosyltransferase family 39 protein n=1 Tax=Haloterrigena gelatinilytica TaxID=2741724 RepID=A0A8J8GPS1_9EURY|nr:glycosyltransferase family 39 protein [Haloterrigena gelatinilytica]NUB93736.1 glycosyltransferase family 39 protein [Haloterrigena gelatinilytica]
MDLFPSLGTATGELAVGVGLPIVLTSVTLAAIRLQSAKGRGRCNFPVVGALLFLALFTVVGWRYDVPGYDVIISALLWSGIWLYVLGTVLWLGLKILALVRYTEPSVDYGHDEIQVRIMTIDAEAVVQETVNSLPETITDRHVIAESPIEIDGATVHVVPDEFSCEATRKGRALEWGRRTLTCDREHILYLDEDTIVTDFDGLPDADIVQFGERPYRTGGIVPYLSEMFRIGFQLEQRTFGLLPVPLYAWGGGIAIRTSLEQRVTWNYDTLIEDTVFTWRAVTEYDASFVSLRTWFYNQAPATVGAMISQRRRWIGGSEQELWRLPRHYQPLFKFRNFVWGMTPIVSIIPLLTLFSPGLVHYEERYLQMSFLLLMTPLLWSILGYDYFREIPLIGVLSIPFTPLITVAHSAGAFVGLLSQPGQFATTTKIGETVDSLKAPARNDGGLSRIGWVRYQIRRIVGSVTTQIEHRMNSIVSAGTNLLVAGYADSEGLPFEHRHLKLRPAAILTIITTVGATVRFYSLGEASYWFDEVYSVTVRGDMPIAELLTASEPHPPLHYLLLKYWMMLFGQGEFATRSLSALFGIGAIVLIYFLCKELFTRSAGYIGAALLALSTFNVHASQTVRMYGPLTFFTIVSLYSMIRVLNKGGYKNCTLYAVSTIGLLFIHLFGGFVVLAQNIYVGGVLLADSNHRWVRLKRWLATVGFVSASYSLFLFSVLLPELRAKTEGSSKAGWITVPTLTDFIEGLMAIGGAPFQYPFADFSSFSINVSRLFLGLAVIAIILSTVRFNSNLSELDEKKISVRLTKVGGRGKLLGIAVFTCCFVLPFVLSFIITPMFIIRYLAPATVGAIVLIAGAVATIRRDSVRVAVMVGLVVSSAGLVGVYHQTSTSEDWRATSDYINSDDSTDPLIILQPAWVSKPLTFYGVPPDSDVVGVYQGEYDFGPAEAGDLRQTIRTHDTVYIVQRKPSTIEPVVKKTKPSHRKVDEQDFGVITVYKFSRESKRHN